MTRKGSSWLWFLLIPFVVLFGGIIVYAAVNGDASELGKGLPGEVFYATGIAIVMIPIFGFMAWQFRHNRALRREVEQLADWGSSNGFLVGETDLSRLNGQIPLVKKARRDSTVYASMYHQGSLEGEIAGHRATIAHLSLPHESLKVLMHVFALLALFAESQRTEWSLCQVELDTSTPPQLGNLSLRPRKGYDHHMVEAFQDAVTEYRNLELESTEFYDFFKLTVLDEADDISMRRFFDPVTIDWLNQQRERGVFVYQRGSSLVVGAPGKLLAGEDLHWLTKATEQVVAQVKKISGSTASREG